MGDYSHFKGLLGEQTTQWKGDDIQYRAAHARITSRRGKPNHCEHCDGTEGHFEWALKHDCPNTKIQVGGVGDGAEYSPRPEDYIRLCHACHLAYDAINEIRACANCGAEFLARQTQERWCTVKCGRDFRNAARFKSPK